MSHNSYGLKEADKPVLCSHPFQQADIFVLTETWSTSGKSPPQVPGYFFFNINAKQPRRGRGAGGIAVYCANKYSGKIKIWRQDLAFLTRIWLECDKSLFQCSEALQLCAVYFPPVGSGLGNRITIGELYQDLLLEVAQALVVDQVVITGDLNARTGTLPDCLDPTLAEHLDLPMDEEFDAFLY